MNVLILCLGFLSCLYLAECTVTGWAAPLGGTADFDAGVMYLNEGKTGTIETVVATYGGSAVVQTIEILTQTVASFFAITTTAGVLTVAGTNVLDGDATTTSHVLTIKATDDAAAVGTVTITYSIIAGQFATGYSCLYLGPELAATGAVMTNAMSSDGTNVITIDSGDTNTDFTIVSGTGVMTAAKDLTAASGTSGSYTIILKGVEAIGTTSTEYSTINICMRGSTCVCTIPSSSAAAHITAGLLGIFAALIMTILK